jgi:hypothetical protein
VKFLLTLLASAILAMPAAAQIDYRNLDQSRPTSVEDAYPLERYGFELSGGYHRSGAHGGGRDLLAPELVYGIARGAQAAVRLPWVIRGGAGAAGLAGAGLSLLVNFSTEGPKLPGLSGRVDASLPVGAAGGHGVGVSLTGLATRSFGTRRVHLNGSVALGMPDVPGAVDPLPRWWLGLAVDQTLIRRSTLLVGEASVASARRGVRAGYAFGFGIRQQLLPTLVGDVGLGWNFKPHARGEFDLTIGLSHSFALAFLMPVRSR